MLQRTLLRERERDKGEKEFEVIYRGSTVTVQTNSYRGSGRISIIYCTYLSIIYEPRRIVGVRTYTLARQFYLR